MKNKSGPKIVVVGDSPVALAIRAKTGAHRGSERAKSPTRFQGTSALVLIAHEADFENSLRIKQPERRVLIEARAERAILDAVIGQVPHVVVVSSAMVHGAQPDREIIADNSPAREITDGFVGDISYFEFCLQRALLNATQAMPGPQLTILRAAPMVGPGIDTLITRHFEAPRLLSLREGSRRWQFIHIDDVANAIEIIIDQELFGPLVVGAAKLTGEQPATEQRDAGVQNPAQQNPALQDGAPQSVVGQSAKFEPDTLSVSKVCALARMRTIELSRTTAFAMAERLHQIGVLPAPPVDMEYAVYDWTVMPSRLLDAGWQPQHTSSQCVAVLMQQIIGKVGVGGRRVAARDAAALGAAGAAVAVLGTAAAWRQVRSGRK